MAKFKQGESGNRAGRPRGAGDKRTALRSAFESKKNELIQVAIDKALSGDTTALRICLDRLIAPMRSNPVRIEGFAGTLAERGEAVMAAIAAGSISPSEGADLTAMLQAQARLVEAASLEARIAALEQRLEGKHGGN